MLKHYVKHCYHSSSIKIYLLILSGPKACQRSSSGLLSNLFCQERNRKGGKCKISGFYNRLFIITKPHQGWRPMSDISRLTPLSSSRKVQMKTPESVRTSLIPGEWVSLIDLSDAYFLIPSAKLKQVPDTVLRVDNKSVRTQPTLVFLFVGYEFHLDLALVNPLREMAQFSRFDPTL